MKRICCVVLVLCLVAMFAPSVFAVPNDMPMVSPRFVAIDTTTVGISIDEDTGIASCDAQCIAQDDYTIRVECKLQRWNGSSWVTIKTWTNTDTYIAYVAEDWAVYKGYNYRVYATFYVYDENGTLLETFSSYDSQSYA